MKKNRLRILILLLLFIFWVPSTAFAYLDPGSSSALLSTVFAAVGAILYSIKSLFYKITGTAQKFDKDIFTDSLVIFSEGKNYWGTFKPIVEELIAQQIPFRYFSLDLQDPGLILDSPFMESRLYRKGPAAFSKLRNIKAPVMLSTTPNIGCDGFPLARPIGVNKLVHVFHAVSDTANYRIGALDYYDSVIMIGKQQVAPLRKIEKIRGLKEKELVAIGLPYLDDLLSKVPQALPPISTKKTVLIGPSWGSKGCFTEYGVDFVVQLAQTNMFNIIIRLHPQSYITEPDLAIQWYTKTKDLENVIWDTEILASESMHKSDILVSDTSSIRFDYAFLYSKPVLTLEIPKESREEYESRYFQTTWTEEASKQLGYTVNHSQINDLPKIIQTALDGFSTAHIDSFRETVIENFGCSASPIIQYLTESISAMGKTNTKRTKV